MSIFISSFIHSVPKSKIIIIDRFIESISINSFYENKKESESLKHTALVSNVQRPLLLAVVRVSFGNSLFVQHCGCTHSCVVFVATQRHIVTARNAQWTQHSSGLERTR